MVELKSLNNSIYNHNSLITEIYRMMQKKLELIIYVILYINSIIITHSFIGVQLFST